MRNADQINDIKSRVIDPYSIENFLSEDEISHLIHIYETDSSNKLYKNTGPVTLDLRHHLDDFVISKILLKLKEAIGPYQITTAFFFKTNYPHIIHNDDLFQLPDGVYRAITIPLKIFRKLDSNEIPKLCFFDQFYFHGPSKFFKGSEDKNIPTYYNQKIHDYHQVDGVLDYNTISENTYKELFTHLEPKWLEGLSLRSALPWNVGSALIFDSTRLHASSDFRNNNIESKLAISIFTRFSPEIKEDAAIKFYEITSS